MNKQLNIIKSVHNCTLYDDLVFPSELKCVKTALSNAILGRIEQNYTQKDVANELNISLRSVIKLEKGKSNNLVNVLRYITMYAYDFTSKRLKTSRLEYYKKK